ncbi:multiple epidermal growth factor-like domains protein 10, partial [Saccostrea echinata]|uniref:multiple epidermal growth factor-like domains protein 10 n=1 Tax=Saccostrea echinata TaxID=191078 RepID=UPI002A7EC5F9
QADKPKFKIIILVNVALNNPTWQSQQISSSTYYSSSNAVDGLKTNLSPGGGQCAISAGQRSATWWVNLTSIYSIGEIWIYYRTDNNVWDASNLHTSRFLGFYVYISNTTERSNGHLCFHDTNYTRSTIPAVVNITCPVHGQYVIYYNERLSGVSYPGEYSSNAYNDLCEVEVLGCISGYYGSTCSLPCPVNCRYCHIETGECQWCEPGYQGYQCKFECNGGTYGQDCADRCGACLDYKQCHHSNGSCLEGCDAGYVGNLCELGCSVGKFGYNCESYCSDKCGVPHRCNRATGECDGGCQSGWKGLQCSEECNDGRYGQKCADRCGTCLGYKQCHHINGSCLEGCDAGFIGEFCTTGCLIGKYGNNCSENCSVNCVEPRRCYGTTGECQRGCLQGWEGIRCDKGKLLLTADTVLISFEL